MNSEESRKDALRFVSVLLPHIIPSYARNEDIDSGV
jgi:hypothetical protein